MLTVMIVIFGLCVSFCVYFIVKEKRFLASFAMGLAVILPMIGAILCINATSENLPDGYEPVSCYVYDGEYGVKRYTTRVVKDGDQYYNQEGLGKALWVPGAPFNYVPTDISDVFCESCGIVCEFPCCVECGQEILAVTCDHQNFENLEYCGVCGAHTGEEH